MEIVQRMLGQVTLLHPVGALDSTTSPGFGERLLEALAGAGEGQPGMAVIDFSDVEFISSAGLRAVMIGAKRARADGGKFAVAALTPTVKEIFEISRFHHVVTVFEGVREALASMSEAAAQAFESTPSGD